MKDEFKNYETILIIGDMLELGESSNELHLKLIPIIKKIKPNILITLGNYTANISKELCSSINCYSYNSVEKLLKDIKGFKLNEPKGAFYVFPDISSFFGKTLKKKKINNASDFAIYLLEKAHVATVTGEAFGSPNNIRISYAASTENIKNAIQRIKNAVED